jgi:hypothetical protein
VSIPAQSLSGTSYINVGKGVEFLLSLSGISYTTAGSLCERDSGSNGTYKGNIFDEVIGGTFSWK